MKFTPTKEQSHIVATASTGVDVIIQAYAGASKTSTLVLVADELKDKSILYLAFNKSIATEATDKMPNNVDCRTVHSVAYQNTDKSILKKLRYNSRPNNKQLAQELGVMPFEALDTKTCDTVYLSDLRLVGWVNKTLQRFMQSSDTVFKLKHTYIDDDYKSLLLDDLKPMLLSCAEKLWKRYNDTNDKLPIPHDVYLKLFSLSGKDLGYDVVMVDEAQDVSPVMLSILKSQQTSQKVYVGDSFQKIYSFTGSIDISDKVDAVKCYLSKSFRFGNEIADEANFLLQNLGATSKLYGNDKKAYVDKTNSTPKAILCRTNSNVLQTYIEELSCNPKLKINISCDTDSILHFAESLLELDSKGKTQHKHLKGFKSINGFYVWLKETDEDVDLDVKHLASVCAKIGTKNVVKALSSYTNYDKPDLTIVTAHKSKGLEWDSIRLSTDFVNPYTNKCCDEERRLFYVAMTRAKAHLNGIAWYKQEALKDKTSCLVSVKLHGSGV